MVVDRYFRENTIVLRKKTQESRKKTHDIKKTQEPQIACLGSARLVTCCQLVQASSRMVVDRYFRENTVVLRKKLKNHEKKTQDLKKTQESQIAVGYLLPIGPDKLPDENIDLQPSGSLSGPIGSK